MADETRLRVAQTLHRLWAVSKVPWDRVPWDHKEEYLDDADSLLRAAGLPPRTKAVVDALRDDLTRALDTDRVADDVRVHVEGFRDALEWVLGTGEPPDTGSVKCENCFGRGGWEHPTRGDEWCDGCEGTGWVWER